MQNIYPAICAIFARKRLPSLKSIFLLLTSFFFALFSFSQTNLHYWDFNNGSSTTTNAAWTSPVAATSTVNSGSLTFNFTQTENFSGSTLDATGFSSTAGLSFCPVNNANNGNSFTLNASTAGYSGIKLTYAAQRTGTGFTSHLVEYATDGTTYTTLTTLTIPSAFALQTLDFSGIAAADNNPNFKVRVTVSGATSSSGNNRIDNIRITGSLIAGGDATPPVIFSLSPGNSVTGVPVNVTASVTFNEGIKKGTGNITIRKNDNSVFQTIDVNTVTISGASASFNLAGLSANTGYFIEIENGAFRDLSDNSFAGISGNSVWAFITGTIFYTTDFQTCSSSLPDGFTQYSVAGAITWGCTTFGRDPAAPSGSAAYPNGVQINGYSGGTNVPNIDWLISPSFDLSTTTYPLLSFWSRTAFNGLPLQLKVSTDYVSGDPGLATWTDLNGKFPSQTSNVWTLSPDINLSAFKQHNVHFAFKYTSSDEVGARWTVDDVSLTNSAIPPSPSLTLSTNDIQYTFVANGSTADKTFTFIANDLTAGQDVTLTATSGFLLSKDGTTFSSSLTYTVAEANDVSKTVFVRFAPTQTNKSYTGTVSLSTSTLSATVNLKGTSIDPAFTLEIVNWNLEWFGSTDPALGPTNDNQQQANVQTILQNIGADIYGLVEVVDEARLAAIVGTMPGYSYVIGNYGSHVNPPDPSGGPLSGAQKEAFVYKTSLFSNISTRPLINSQDITSSSYYNWSSGRYPFLMTADITLNGQTKRINFVLIHAKANTSPTTTSYTRRQAAAIELHDTLLTYFANENVIILGDFNDDLDQSITAGFTTTSYSAFTSDNANFFSPTLALSMAGKKSTVSYTDVIDHVLVSNEMQAYFMNSSASILTDVSSLVANYGATTTDHYPIFTRFAFDATILPVKLVNFSAVKENKTVKLTWTTTEEVNAKEFRIEKSVDGRNFYMLGKVAAAGNSTIRTNYQFTDVQPSAGDNFYRLKAMDIDGKSEISRVLKINFEQLYTFHISPNPATSELTVTVLNSTEPLYLQLVDISGKVVASQSVTNSSNKINLKNLAKGFYLVKINSSTKSYTEKLIIE